VWGPRGSTGLLACETGSERVSEAGEPPSVHQGERGQERSRGEKKTSGRGRVGWFLYPLLKDAGTERAAKMRGGGGSNKEAGERT